MEAERNEACEHHGQRADATTRLQLRRDRVALPETINEVEEGTGGQGSSFFRRWNRSVQGTHSLTSFGTNYWCLCGRYHGRKQLRAWQMLQGLCSISSVALSRKIYEYIFIEASTSYTRRSPV